MLLTSCLYPVVHKILSRLNANKRTNWRLLYAFSPLFIASLALGLFLKPEILPNLVVNHCHGLTCEPHWLALTHSGYESLTLIFFTFIVFSGFSALIIRQLLISQRFLSALKQLSSKTNKQSNSTNYRVVELTKPLAWCAGLLTPTVYVSRGLLEQLPTHEINLILKHEYCHASRHDNLRKWLLHWVTWHWPRPLKKTIRQAYHYDTELICDLAAIGKRPLEEFMATLNNMTQIPHQHCQAEPLKTNEPITDPNHAKRIKDLGNEFVLAQQNTISLSLKLGCAMLSISVSLVLITVHFGHPFFEYFFSK